MSQILKSLALACCIITFLNGCTNNGNAISSEAIDAIQITSYPEKIDKTCRGGKAKIFDECADQVDLFNQAMSRAKAEGKIVLVSYGAEWCIWCHVFDAYINGDTDKFTYTYGQPRNDERYTHTMRERATEDVSQQAYDLKTFVSENFVVAHIDYEHSPDGDDVLSQAKAWDNFDGGVPYIFTVDTSGLFAADFDHDKAELRRDTDDWYRGYDRVQLLAEMKRMQAAAIKP